jgi:Lectin C-type domain
MTRGFAMLPMCLALGCTQNPYLIGEYSPLSEAGAPPSGLSAEQCLLTTQTEKMRYFTCAHPRTWSSAEVTCAMAQGTLASVGNETVEAALAGAVMGEAWLGFYAPNDTRIFEWIDGAVASYEAFLPTEPDNLGGNETCVALAAGSDAAEPGWDDRDCIVDLPFICAIPE